MFLNPRATTLTGLASAAALLLSGANPATASTSPTAKAEASQGNDSLLILLSNDDGVGRGGMAELRRALCEAGHDVVVSAPTEDKSGSGGSFAFSGTLTVATSQDSCDGRATTTYAVAGTPADSVLFGLDVVLKDRRPDLVITGINPGQNIGAIMNLSGTVGGAIAAARAGYPALTVSVEVAGGGQTAAAMPAAAEYTVNLVERLQKSAQTQPILPRDTVLNVAYPVVLNAAGQHDPDLVRGSRVTNAGTSTVARGLGNYTELHSDGASTTYRVEPPHICASSDPCEERVKNADSTALRDDYVSITPLETNFGAERYRGEVMRRLAPLDSLH